MEMEEQMFSWNMAPVLEIQNATLSGIPYFGLTIFWGDDGLNETELGFQPVFTQCSQELYTDTRIWDLGSLVCSVRIPSAFYLITCTCGVPDNTEIYEEIYVSHPNEKSIIWELPLACYGRFFLNVTEREGYARLIFERDAYEQSIRKMLHIALKMAEKPISPAQYNVYAPVNAYGKSAQIALDEKNLLIESILPQNETIKDFCSVQLVSVWEPESLFPESSYIQIGLDSSNMPVCVINGKSKSYFSFYCMRFCVQKALTEWYNALYVMKETNSFDSPNVWAEIHEKGRIFTKMFFLSLQEGNTTSNARVEYKELLDSATL